MNINKLSTIETANYIEKMVFPRRFDSLTHEEIGKALTAMYMELATTATRSPPALAALGLELRGELLKIELATRPVDPVRDWQEASTHNEDEDENEGGNEDNADDEDDDDDDDGDGENEPDPDREPASDTAQDPASDPTIADTQEI